MRVVKMGFDDYTAVVRAGVFCADATDTAPIQAGDIIRVYADRYDRDHTDFRVAYVSEGTPQRMVRCEVIR